MQQSIGPYWHSTRHIKTFINYVDESKRYNYFYAVFTFSHFFVVLFELLLSNGTINPFTVKTFVFSWQQAMWSTKWKKNTSHKVFQCLIFDHKMATFAPFISSKLWLFNDLKVASDWKLSAVLFALVQAILEADHVIQFEGLREARWRKRW